MNYPRRDYKTRIAWTSGGTFITIPTPSTDFEIQPWQPVDWSKVVSLFLGVEDDGTNTDKATIDVYGSHQPNGAGRWLIATGDNVPNGPGVPTVTAWAAVGLYAFASGQFQYSSGGFKTTIPILPTYMSIRAKNAGPTPVNVRIWIDLAEIP